jgi:hypothetical protein
MKNKIILCGASTLFLLLFLFGTAQANEWQNVGTARFVEGEIQSITTDNSGNPYITVSGQKPKKFDGTSWADLGDGPVCNDSCNIKYNAVNNQIYLIWSQGTTYYIKKYNGSSWEDVGDGSICSVQTNDGLLHGTVSALDFHPQTGQPYVICNVVSQDQTGWEVKVKRYDGSSWVDVGPVVADENHPFGTDLTFDQGRRDYAHVVYYSTSGGHTYLSVKSHLDPTSGFPQGRWLDEGSANFAEAYASADVNPQIIFESSDDKVSFTTFNSSTNEVVGHIMQLIGGTPWFTAVRTTKESLLIKPAAWPIAGFPSSTLVLWANNQCGTEI